MFEIDPRGFDWIDAIDPAQNTKWPLIIMLLIGLIATVRCGQPPMPDGDLSALWTADL